MFKVHRTFDLSTGVKNNSIAVLDTPNRVAVIYHQTLVVHFNKDKKVFVIRNGGYDTVSTRIVINRALFLLNCGMYLERRKGETVLVDPKNDVRLPFGNVRNGVTVHL